MVDLPLDTRTSTSLNSPSPYFLHQLVLYFYKCGINRKPVPLRPQRLRNCTLHAWLRFFSSWRMLHSETSNATHPTVYHCIQNNHPAHTACIYHRVSWGTEKCSWMLRMSPCVQRPFENSTHLRYQRSYDFDLDSFLRPLSVSHGAFLISFARRSTGIMPAANSIILLDAALKALKTFRASKPNSPMPRVCKRLLSQKWGLKQNKSYPCS